MLVRVMLPLSSPDGSWTTWATWDAEHHGLGVDGLTEAAALTELWAGDAASPRTGGWGAPAVEAGFRQLWSSGADQVRWFPTAGWDEGSMHCLRDPSDQGELMPVDTYLAEVSRAGFRGLAELGTMTVESPPYPDSVLLTGDEGLLDRARGAGLEAYEVTRAVPFKISSY